MTDSTFQQKVLFSLGELKADIAEVKIEQRYQAERLQALEKAAEDAARTALNTGAQEIDKLRNILAGVEAAEKAVKQKRRERVVDVVTKVFLVLVGTVIGCVMKWLAI